MSLSLIIFQAKQHNMHRQLRLVGKANENAQRRDLLINLQMEVPDFSHSFTQLIDFVPVEETQKAQARERYKILRSQGWTLSTENT